MARTLTSFLRPGRRPDLALRFIFALMLSLKNLISGSFSFTTLSSINLSNIWDVSRKLIYSWHSEFKWLLSFINPTLSNPLSEFFDGTNLS